MIDDSDKQEYRHLLQELEQKAQESYDKTLLTLSSGALSISLVFLKDVLKAQPSEAVELIVWAWSMWASSLTAILLSFFFSQCALAKTVQQLDDEKLESETPGGWFNRATGFLNAVGGILFLSGVVLIVVFAAKNLR